MPIILLHYKLVEPQGIEPLANHPPYYGYGVTDRKQGRAPLNFKFDAEPLTYRGLYIKVLGGFTQPLRVIIGSASPLLVYCSPGWLRTSSSIKSRINSPVSLPVPLLVSNILTLYLVPMVRLELTTHNFSGCCSTRLELHRH